MAEDLQRVREFYARYLVAGAASTNERLIRAFAKVPRERFVGSGPWLVSTGAGYLPTPSDDPRYLYQDLVIGLVPEKKINNGQPTLHARCLAAVDPRPGETVVHIGAGTGYYTALLDELVAPSGKVHAYEVDESLAERAVDALRGRERVTVHRTNACDGAVPSADVIYVNAGVTRLPEAWLDALNIGGRLLAPLTPDEGFGGMLMVTRESPDAFAARILARVGFISCAGARDDAESAALAKAFEGGAFTNVRSLRRNALPDDSAWYAAAGWWLSTKEPAQH